MFGPPEGSMGFGLASVRYRHNGCQRFDCSLCAFVFAFKHCGRAMGARIDEGSEEEWRDTLKSFVWKSTEDRLRDLCKFLESEGLTWRTVGLLGDPAEWAPQFTAEEVHGVITFGKSGRTIPRLGICLFSESSCVHVCVRCSGNATVDEAVTPSQTQQRGVGWAGLQRLGPRAAHRCLIAVLGGDEDRKRWVEDAKLHAILGSMGLSLDYVISGLRCYVAFVGRTLYRIGGPPCLIGVACAEHVFPEVRQVFPPQRDLILSWSAMFRSGGTVRNYLGYVKTGCMVMNKSTIVSGTC